MQSRILFKAALTCALILSASCADVSAQDIVVDTADYPKHVEVLGLHVYATAAASADEVLHAASVLAEYLDNDKDGVPDNQKIVDAMIRANATLVVAKDSEDKRAHHRPWPNSQGVYTDEIFPLGQNERYDGALEEVLHLITDYGWENAYPSAFGRWRGTRVANASEAARGGYFEKSPEQYPAGAWHTYYSETCDYGCNIAEYTHWALTSILGAHERYWKEIGGKDQWDLRSKEKVMAGDPAIYALLTDPQYKLPTVLPDGNYRGKELRIQHGDEESTTPNADSDTARNTKSEMAHANLFTKQIAVFGIHIYATDMVADNKMIHTADVLAQYLDNDEDGTPDNQDVVDAIVRNGGGVFMTEYQAKYEWDDLRKYLPPGPKASVYDDQTYPNALVDGVFNIPREQVLEGAQDAPWEEVLHLITSQGYAQVYPSVFGYAIGSELANAMDLARGGHFPDRRPEQYPDGAWYTYYDNYSCGYECMISEYVYWALTSILGAQAVPGRSEGIQDEWKLPTKEQVRTGDPAVYALLTNPKYKFPTVLPDSEYRAKTFTIQEFSNTGNLSVTSTPPPDLKALSSPDTAGGLLVSNSLLPENILSYLSCEAVLFGEPITTSTPLFELKISTDPNAPGSHWDVTNDTFSYTWHYDEGIKLDFAATVAGSGLQLRYTLTNTTEKTMKRVLLHNCVPTTDAPAFFPGETKSLSEGKGRVGRYMGVYSRTFLWSKGQSFNFAETALGNEDIHLAFMREGHTPIEWEWWTNGPETFDYPFIAVQSKNGKFTTALGFEAAEWACINAGDRNACYHLFPFFGDLEPGESATVRGCFYLMPGTPEDALKQFKEDYPGAK